MAQCVDIHSHLLLPALYGKAGELGPEIVHHDDGRASLRVGGRFTKIRSVDSIEQERIWGLRGAAERYLRSLTDPLTRVAEMDEKGIDILGVTNNPQMYFYGIDAGVARRFQSAANDALAEYCSAAPSRFFFMATLPLQDLSASMTELDRAVELGARGINVGAHSLGGRELYDEQLWPLYARIAEAGLPLFIHPYPFELVGVPPLRFSGPMLEFPYQSSMAAANLILSGALDEVPDLKVCISHGGGFLPYQFGRIEAFAKLNPAVRAKKPLREYLPRLYFDGLIHEVTARQYLVDWMGPSNVLVGDNLGGLDSADGFAYVRELGLDAAAAEQINGGNAIKLFRL
ncbi:amidohydrolase family protein [Amycolatopsis ultiminotia]|uniref:Amidohydrolase family protein n=1 Tax=Amycolatopsis ultiminotia TaxID=543629 RepID=A0ABP6YFN9_9PSEU